MIKFKIELIFDEISKINDRDKKLIDIDTIEMETKYKLLNVKLISKYACTVLSIIHPVVVTKHRMNGEYYYRVLANKRTLHIAKSVLNKENKIPMIVIKNRAIEALRDVSSIDCLGSVFIYSCDDRKTLKNLIKKMKKVFRIIFPTLTTNKKIANSIGEDVETLFYNIKDRKKTQKNEDSEADVGTEKDNLSERYEEE